MFGELKSKFHVRRFAIEQANISLSKLNGEDKPLIELAKEIETYILGSAELPEYVNDKDAFECLLETFKKSNGEKSTATDDSAKLA